jgi:hypothetical protein
LSPLSSTFDEVADDSNQKILVLVLWQGIIQAEHLYVVRKAMEFYYRNGRRSLQGWRGVCQVE